MHAYWRRIFTAGYADRVRLFAERGIFHRRARPRVCYGSTSLIYDMLTTNLKIQDA